MIVTFLKFAYLFYYSCTTYTHIRVARPKNKKNIRSISLHMKFDICASLSEEREGFLEHAVMVSYLRKVAH